MALLTPPAAPHSPLGVAVETDRVQRMWGERNTCQDCGRNLRAWESLSRPCSACEADPAPLVSGKAEPRRDYGCGCGCGACAVLRCACGHMWGAHDRGSRCIAAGCSCQEWGDR